MKRSAFTLIALLALASCNKDVPSQNRHVIDYQIQNNEYAVVVVQEEGVNESEAKKQALQSAAEIARKNHYRYFSIEKEEQVQAMSSDSSSYPNSKMPKNIYYELIQTDNFGRDKLQDQNAYQSQIYPAYRLTFKCYRDKPDSSAIDSCSLVDCNN